MRLQCRGRAIGSALVMAAAAAGVLSATPAAAVAYLGPSGYLSAADSPFGGVTFSYFHLENFEDGALNTPGLSAVGGSVVGPGSFTDSVDADDGTIDGFGTSGYSYYSAGAQSITFNFNGIALGNLPTRVGVVWTDVGFVLSGGTIGFGNVQIEAFDQTSASLGVFGPFAVGDGAFGGQTAEDRFLGAIHPGGISRLVVTMPDSTDWELDHVQYGYDVPVPAPFALLAAGLGLMGLLRIRHNR
jgi:hypothetical protein